MIYMSLKSKKGDEVIATITPGSIEDMQAIIEDLDNGEDVNGWENGNGAVKKGTVGKRIGRRVVGKATGRAMRRLFK